MCRHLHYLNTIHLSEIAGVPERDHACYETIERKGIISEHVLETDDDQKEKASGKLSSSTEGVKTL